MSLKNAARKTLRGWKTPPPPCGLGLNKRKEGGLTEITSPETGFSTF